MIMRISRGLRGYEFQGISQYDCVRTAERYLHDESFIPPLPKIL